MEPSTTEIVYYIFLGVFTSFSQVIIILICLYYFYKMGSKIEGILILVASIISLLCGIATILGTLYATSMGSDTYVTFNSVNKGCSTLAALIFVIGFFLLIRKVVKSKAITQS